MRDQQFECSYGHKTRVRFAAITGMTPDVIDCPGPSATGIAGTECSAPAQLDSFATLLLGRPFATHEWYAPEPAEGATLLLREIPHEEGLKPGDKVRVNVPFEVAPVEDMQILLDEIGELADTTEDGIPIADEIFWIRRDLKLGEPEAEVIGRLQKYVSLEKALRLLVHAEGPKVQRQSGPPGTTGEWLDE